MLMPRPKADAYAITMPCGLCVQYDTAKRAALRAGDSTAHAEYTKAREIHLRTMPHPVREPHRR